MGQGRSNYKLLRYEAESEALLNHLDAYSQADLITSALATVETARALTALGEVELASRAVRRSDRIEIDGGVIVAVSLSSRVLDLVRALPPAVPRSLDAIHLATAKLAADSFDHIITYDKRMLVAAEAAELSTASPS